MGFDYEVVSHRERYAGGDWQSEETQETRIRWEPRAGRLDRHYDNVIAPALDAHAAFVRALGDYRVQDARPYAAPAMADALVCLPDRAQSAAWGDAVPGFQHAAAEECRRAAQADHVRRFRWEPSYAQRNWTLLLLPVYGTYYLDDEGQPQPVFVNGQSGQLSGARRASMQAAQKSALFIGIIAAIVFVLGLVLGAVGLVVPPLIVVGIIVAIVGFLGGVIGVPWCLISASRFNRKQS
jgi:hypothetical protein